MEGELNLMVKLILSIVLGGFVGLLCFLYNGVLMKPKKLRLKLEKQGIKGPCPSLLYGNIHEMRRIQLEALSAASSTQKDHQAAIAHDWFPTLFPYLDKWRNEYGRCSLYHSVITCLDSTTHYPPVLPLGKQEHGVLQPSTAFSGQDSYCVCKC